MMNTARLAMGVAVLAGVLAGCAAPESHYYSLSSPIPAASDSSSPRAGAIAARYAISVQPVSLPAQVDRPQIIVSSSDSTQVVPLNQSLWAAPLSDEIRNALSNDLMRQLNALDIVAQDAPESLPLWKIYLTVQRFDSVYNHHVVLEATWRLDPANQARQAVTICRAQAQVPVGKGMPALIAGQQQALHRFASAIAAQLSGRSLASVPGITLEGCK